MFELASELGFFNKANAVDIASGEIRAHHFHRHRTKECWIGALQDRAHSASGDLLLVCEVRNCRGPGFEHIGKVGPYGGSPIAWQGNVSAQSWQAMRSPVLTASASKSEPHFGHWKARCILVSIQKSGCCHRAWFLKKRRPRRRTSSA
jgi:hypothetical protein